MAQVTVTIDGKAYRMACEEGQENHLIGLAQNFDQYVMHLKKQFGEIGDLRLTVMAAIMIMDELFEANRKSTELQNELEQVRASHDGMESVARKTDDMVAGMLTELTRQVRSISTRLDGDKKNG